MTSSQSSYIELYPVGSPGRYGRLSGSGHCHALLCNPCHVAARQWVWYLLSLNRKRCSRPDEAKRRKQTQTAPIVSSCFSSTRALGWFGLPALCTASRVIAGWGLVQYWIDWVTIRRIAWRHPILFHSLCSVSWYLHLVAAFRYASNARRSPGRAALIQAFLNVPSKRLISNSRNSVLRLNAHKLSGPSVSLRNCGMSNGTSFGKRYVG